MLNSVFNMLSLKSQMDCLAVSSEILAIYSFTAETFLNASLSRLNAKWSVPQKLVAKETRIDPYKQCTAKNANNMGLLFV